MSEKDLHRMVDDLIAELRRKIEYEVPDENDFPMVYSEFKIADNSLCLTDIMLSFCPKPHHLPDHKTERWLELTGYKLPAPYKSSIIIFAGSKNGALVFLNQPEATSKILSLIPQLDSNMIDV